MNELLPPWLEGIVVALLLGVALRNLRPGLAVLRTAGAIPEALLQPTRLFGSWLTVLAMAGLGLGVRLSAIRTVGFPVALAAIASLVVLVSVTLALIGLLGIDA